MISNILGPNGSFVKWNTEEATRDTLEWEIKVKQVTKASLSMKPRHGVPHSFVRNHDVQRFHYPESGLELNTF